MTAFDNKLKEIKTMWQSKSKSKHITKCLFINSLFTAKPIYVNSVLLRALKKIKVEYFFQSEKWNNKMLEA